MMKNILVLVCLLLLATAAVSQTRSRTTKRSAPAAKTTVTAADQAIAQARTTGATKVADQNQEPDEISIPAGWRGQRDRRV